MHWVMIAAGVIIAALFGTTLWQAREIGELKAEVAVAEALAEYKAVTAAASQAFNDEAAARISAAETELQEVTNERERDRVFADKRAQDNPADVGDVFSDDLAVWMRCVASDNRTTCRLYPTGTNEASTVN